VIKEFSSSTQSEASTNHSYAQDMEYLPKQPKKSAAERLLRNLSLSGMLLLAIVALRNHQLPSGQTIMTAINHTVTSDWSEDLGKISFVSSIIPESIAVFFSSPSDLPLVAPCYGEINHPWSRNEPFIAYQASDSQVFAMASGQVMSLAHGADEERIVRIRHDQGLETIYYHLKNVYVREGDHVTASSVIGECIPALNPMIEVHRDGLSIDPSALLTMSRTNPLQ